MADELAFLAVHLDPPLAELAKHCETDCVEECCGLGAFDFSPERMSAFIAPVRYEQMREIRRQMDAMPALSAAFRRRCAIVHLGVVCEFAEAEVVLSLADTLKAAVNEAAARLGMQ